MHLTPVKTHDIVHRLNGERLGAARILGHQQQIEAASRRAAGNGSQIDNRDNLFTDIGHAEQRRLHARRAGDSRHRHDFA